MQKHVELARQANLPVIIHCREAYDDFYALWDDCGGASPTAGGVMHCFGSTPSDMEEALKRGLYISLPCTLTYADAEHLRTVAAVCPLDKLVVETDSPYLPPRGMRPPRRNEPKYTTIVMEHVVQLRLDANRSETEEMIREQIFRNSLKLFGVKKEQQQHEATLQSTPEPMAQ